MRPTGWYNDSSLNFSSMQFAYDFFRYASWMFYTQRIEEVVNTSQTDGETVRQRE